MPAKDAVEFMIRDHGDIGSGFRGDFAKDKPIRSILQRYISDDGSENGITLEDALDLFDWKEDDAAWLSEYGKKGGGDSDKMIRFRRRLCYCLCGWREFNEDFGRGDVSCLRDIRTPLVTSRSPLRQTREEFDAK